MTVLSPTKWKQIKIEMASQDANLTRIAKHYGVSRVALYQYFKRHGWDLHIKQPHKVIGSLRAWLGNLISGKQR